MTFVRVTFAFVPVSLFLWSLLYIDSYKLVGLHRLLNVVASGFAAAFFSYIINKRILDGVIVDRTMLTHFVAPAVEEALKLIPIVFLLRKRRIGFVIDAAICGFATGGGFALVENLYYMAVLPQRDIAF